MTLPDLLYKHRDYVKYQPMWTICRDAMEGEDAVKAKTTTYLPRPSGQTSDEYAAYITRAPFFNATSRTLDAMIGLVFRKTPVLTSSETVEKLAEHVTTDGMSLADFARLLMSEVVSVYRAGVLVEYPRVDTPYVTVQDIEDNGYRPYLTMYTAENIFDWRETIIKGRKVLSYLKLHEYVDIPNGWQTEVGHQYRVFWINEMGECQYAVFQDSNGNIVDITPSDPFIYISGQRIGFIPFSFCGPLTATSSLKKPPLYDLAKVNIHHYQAGADRANAVHWADSPTPIFFGQILTSTGEEVEAIKLGSSSAINMQQGGDAKYLEFQGAGITPTKELMAEYKEEMALLGSKILSSDSRAAEVAATSAIHRAGENSVLAAISKAMSASITQAMKWMLRFLGMDAEVSYRLNTDFYPTPMDSQTLIALIGAVQARKLSDEEFFESLVEGEVIRSDKKFEDHKAEIDAMPKEDPLTAASGNTFGTPSKTVEPKSTTEKESKA